MVGWCEKWGHLMTHDGFVWKDGTPKFAGDSADSIYFNISYLMLSAFSSFTGHKWRYRFYAMPKTRYTCFTMAKLACRRCDRSKSFSVWSRVLGWGCQLPPCGYGSIPINSIFRGMNIHLPAILMFTRGTRFWHTAMFSSACPCATEGEVTFRALLAALEENGEEARALQLLWEADSAGPDANQPLGIPWCGWLKDLLWQWFGDGIFQRNIW